MIINKGSLRLKQRRIRPIISHGTYYYVINKWAKSNIPLDIFNLSDHTTSQHVNYRYLLYSLVINKCIPLKN